MSKLAVERLAMWVALAGITIALATNTIRASVTYGRQSEKIQNNTKSGRDTHTDMERYMTEIRANQNKMLEDLGELKGSAHKHGS